MCFYEPIFNHSIETTSMVDPSITCFIEGPCVISTQSAEVRLAVSGGQHLFTFGFHMLVLTLEYSLSLP